MVCSLSFGKNANKLLAISIIRKYKNITSYAAKNVA